jgi:putative thioredoxin
VSNFGAAFDLSNLNPNQSADTVTGWLVPADESTLRKYLELSERVPVVMLVSDSTEASARVRIALEQMIASAQGRLAGLEISLESSPQLAAAVAVDQAPAALAILGGQPAPIFKGEPTTEQLAQVLSQVLAAAAQNKISGSVTLGQAQAPKPMSPEHQAAFEALDRGDFQGAQAAYEKILVEFPNDSEAKAALAQVKLMIRLNQAPQGELDKLFAQADQLVIGANPGAAFEVLLSRFETDFDNREAIRERMLDLFTVVGAGEQVVLEARRKLTSLLF